MAKIIVLKTLSAASTLTVFYYSFRWLRGASAELKALSGATDDISQLVAALFVSAGVVAAIGWLVSKIERVPKTGSTWAMMSALNLSASILVPEAYTRVHLSWVLLATGFTGFLLGALQASAYAKANNSWKLAGWTATFTEILTVITGVAVIFFIITQLPAKNF